MKNLKLFYVVTLFFLLIIFILVGGLIYKIDNNNTERKNKETLAKEMGNEYIEEEISNDIISVTSEEEIITPNTSFIMKKIYDKCGHSVKEEVEMPKEWINKSEKELEIEYKNWDIEKFSREEVIIFKKENGYCDKHYILREREGIVAIYALDKDGKEVFKEDTSIGVEYLTETDWLSIRQGMQIYGDEELNSFLEDFE